MIKKLKITVLSENKCRKPGFQSEHGISLYIEADDKKYLFDTGASDIFWKNAQKLKIGFKDLAGIILSHSHYDHTGGLYKFKDKQVYLQKKFFEKKFKYESQKYQYIGPEFEPSFYVDKQGLRFYEVEDYLELSQGIKLISGFAKESKKSKFFIKTENEFIEDLFADELIMTLDTERGLVIITGCSHSGIINIISRAVDVNQNKKIFGLFGGFHLAWLSEKENEIIAEQIDSYQIENIGISHCTGDKLAKYLSYGSVFAFNVADKFALKEV